MSTFDSPAIEALVDRARTPLDAGDVKEEVDRALGDHSLTNHDRGQLLLAQLVGSQGELGADESAAKAAEAVSLLRDTGSAEAIISALAIYAAVSAATGNRATCLECCLDMSSIVRTRHDTELSYRAAINFGAALVVLGAYDLAAPLFARAIHESISIGQSTGLIISSVNLAMTLSRQRLVAADAALASSQADHLDLIESAVRDIETGALDKEMRAFQTAVLADVATMRGDLDAAVLIWGDLDALTAHPAQSFVQYFCLVEAPLAVYQGDFDRAHRLIEGTLEHLATPHVVPLGRVDALCIRSQVHERQGNLAASLVDARDATQLALHETNGLADLLIGQVDQRALLEETQRALLDHTTQLTEQALIDELSKLGNRRAYQAAVENARQTPTADIAMLICDIDCFKDVNDRYGHNVGDAVIAQVAAIAAEAGGGVGQAFRYGGDEFVILPGPLNIEAALDLAEQVRKTVETSPWSDLGVDEPLTCSIGIWVGRSSDIDDGLEQADAFLYAAKHAGRNCVRPVSATTSSTSDQLVQLLAAENPTRSPG